VTEQAHHPVPDDTATAPDAEPTGHPAVDEVLASLARLEDRPAAEHVEVFEAAHERLRGALAGAGDTSTTG
jgi:hypothetical protein